MYVNGGEEQLTVDQTLCQSTSSLHEGKVQLQELKCRCQSPAIPTSSRVNNHFCSTQSMWHSLGDLLDPWLRSVRTLPRKRNEIIREMGERKMESHLSPVLCAYVGAQGKICTGSCVHHTWQGHCSPLWWKCQVYVFPVFMCSLPRLLLVVAATESGRQSWERNIFLQKVSLTTYLTFKFRFWKIHFIYYVFNLK